MCDGYRENLMALLDGELSGTEKERVETHISHCALCRHEFESFAELNQLTSGASLAMSRSSVDWDSYYKGVCRKMDSRASWLAWSVGSLLLVISGVLMLFSLGRHPLAIVLGAMAISAGIGLLWLSHFCSCTRAPKPRVSLSEDDLFA